MSRRCHFFPLSLCLLALAMPGAITTASAEDAGSVAETENGVDAEPVTPPEPIAVEPQIDLDTVVAQRMDVNDSTAESQVRIDDLSAQADKAIAIYRNTNQRIDALRTYNHQLEELIASQDKEVAALRQEIDEVELIAREVTPLMLGMIEALDNFVELDVPFLAEERAVRIADLRKLMGRADVTDSERYRRIVGRTRSRTNTGAPSRCTRTSSSGTGRLGWSSSCGSVASPCCTRPSTCPRRACGITKNVCGRMRRIRAAPSGRASGSRASKPPQI
jgi:hypothetical protein